ncbi:hypothetical protein PV10_02669 [Exophiala mesophila]|uniref:Uncharacterized protein n=1 Tax=Exophiala mesophila TaxID=212818 RepID=A0A0D1WZL5_EXOME|nr:uncharacterized protein PV10_02669 [Exophiala mesophila]KIV94955.1 hypothetical protein PV10_02669 [Exophiala mesophila]
MSDEDSFDAEAAMRQAMGFSSFAVRRPKQETVSDPFQSDIAQETQAATDLPPAEHQGPSLVQRARNASRQGASRTDLPGTSTEQIAFTSPDGKTTYTRSELNEWARGKPNNNGDLVFFKPGFITEDPWSRLRGRNLSTQ